MIAIVRALLLFCLWFYVALFLGWWGLHSFFGDTIWWLALVNSFVPLLFVPLLLLIPLAPLVRHPLYHSGLLIPLTYCLLVYGPLFLPKRTPPYLAEPAPFTILTFNLWSGSSDATTLNVVREAGLPAIVALQETNHRLNRLIRAELGADYPYQFYENTLNGRGISTLSRFPMQSIRTDMLIDLNCRVFWVTVRPTHHFLLYNCHPQSSNLLYFLGDGRPMGEQINETFLLRRRLSQAILADIQQRDEPAIVVGDFNSTDQSDAYAILRGALADSHWEAGWGLGHTFPAYRGSYQGIPILSRLVRIDMVRHSSEFVALRSTVSASHGESDHLPLIVTLAWRP